MIDLLKRHKIVICAGTGGVGKTSMSASLGVLAARSGLKTLVLTIDPARRLAQSLGLPAQAGGAVKVPGIEGLSAEMIDPRREFDRFVLGAVDNKIAKGLFNNRLYQQLVGNLNGSQEFTSLVKLIEVSQSRAYDLVILDTPPTQNAIEFLQAPERIYALFQDSVVGWFANPSAQENWLRRTFHRGTRLVTGALEKVTGSVFIHELKDFFGHISHLKEEIARISLATREVLHQPTTGFLLVTGFDETKLKEALEFQQDLKVEGLHLRGIIVNRWFPEWTLHQRTWPPEWDKDPDFHALKVFYDRFSEFFAHRQEAYEEFAAQIGGRIPVLKLPDFKNNVQGLEDLKSVANIIEKKWRTIT